MGHPSAEMTETTALQTLSTVIRVNYIERECANVEEIVSAFKDSEDSYFSFLGPMGCGKTSTLQAVYENTRDLQRVFIDMNAMGSGEEEAVKALWSSGSSKIIFLVDNAQILATKDSASSALVRAAIKKRSRGLCFAYSPVVCDASGDSVLGSDLRGETAMYFTPFTRAEFEVYKGNHAQVFDDLNVEYTGYIPSILESVRKGITNTKRTKEHIKQEVVEKLAVIVQHHLIKLESAIKNKGTAKEAYNLEMTLLKAVAYGCDRKREHLLHHSGFCYKMSTGEYKLVHPKEVLLDRLDEHVIAVAHIIRSFNIGASLEYEFCIKAQRGFTAKGARDYVTVPKITKTWSQPTAGYCPPTDTIGSSECLMIKLAENHYAIDFLILDCTVAGVKNRRLYFVQVSAQKYTHRPKKKRYSAMISNTNQLQCNKMITPPKKYYSQRLKVAFENCFFIYASPTKSGFGKDASKVYALDHIFQSCRQQSGGGGGGGGGGGAEE